MVTDMDNVKLRGQELCEYFQKVVSKCLVNKKSQFPKNSKSNFSIDSEHAKAGTKLMGSTTSSEPADTAAGTIIG